MNEEENIEQLEKEIFQTVYKTGLTTVQNF